MSAAQVKEAAERQALNEEQYLEFKRRPEVRRNVGSSAKIIRALIARSLDIRTGNGKRPGTGKRRATLLKVREMPRKRINDGVYPRQGLTLPRGLVKILYQILGQEVFRRSVRKPRKQGPRSRTSCLLAT